MAEKAAPGEPLVIPETAKAAHPEAPGLLELTKAFPHYYRADGTIAVPKEIEANLKYREQNRKWAAASKKNRSVLYNACAADVLYFFNSVCWIFEPRPRKKRDGGLMPKQIPFITWPHQDVAIPKILQTLGFGDIGIEKARSQGGSWIGALIALHQWLFEPMTVIGMSSKDEKTLDTAGDLNMLMPKIDWELEKLPVWIAGVKGIDYTRNFSNHVLFNKRNESVITGYAATGELASGSRAAWFLMDELSKFPSGRDKEAMIATQSVTDSRLIVGTPYGPSGAYYEAMHSESIMAKITLRWEDNPTNNRGLYTLQEGIPIAVEESNPLPAGYAQQWDHGIRQKLLNRGYDLKIAGKQRSPWYDKQCLRVLATPTSIAQELDRDYSGSAALFFNVSVIDDLLKETKLPLYEGQLVFNTNDFVAEWIKVDGGHLKLWFEFPEYSGDRPPRRNYVVGVDVAAGQGGVMSSNSTLSVVDIGTGTKVAEYACPTISPESFAEYAISLCKWFAGPHGSAQLFFEANGVGGIFKTKLKNSQTMFSNIVLRPKKKGPPGPEWGWWSGTEEKKDLLGAYRDSLERRTFTNPSRMALIECKMFIYMNNSVIHASSRDLLDQSGAKENHGDRVIADALANWVVRQQSGPRGSHVTAQNDVPSNQTPYGRRKLAQQKDSGKDLWVNT